MGEEVSCLEPCCQPPRQRDRRRRPHIEVLRLRTDLLLHLDAECRAAESDVVETNLAKYQAIAGVDRRNVWRHLRWLTDHGWLNWTDRRTKFRNRGAVSDIGPNYGKAIGGIEVRYWLTLIHQHRQLKVEVAASSRRPNKPPHCPGCTCGMNDVQLRQLLWSQRGLRVR